MTIIYLSIGSNISPELNFRKCAELLEREFDHVHWSPVYRTKPIGISGPDFLNAVVRAQTGLTAFEVADVLKTLERQQGRDKQENAFSSRTLDLDLLLFGREHIDSPSLTIPRKELITMGFVLKPMADIAGEEIHPLLNDTYNSLLQKLSESDPQQLSGIQETEIFF